MMSICCCGETQMTLLSQNKEWVKGVVVGSIPQLINVCVYIYIYIYIWQQYIVVVVWFSLIVFVLVDANMLRLFFIFR